MDRKELYHEIKSRWQEIYPKDRSGKGITCPLRNCNHGQGNHREGITLYKNGDGDNILHCFKCGFTGSVIDLVMEDQGISEKEAVEYCARKLGLSTDGAASNYKEYKKPMRKEENTKYKYLEVKQPNTPEKFSDLIERAHAALKDNSKAQKYLLDRAITPEIQERFNLGFEVFREFEPETKQYIDVPRIIIPYSKENSYYIARRIDEKSANKYRKPKTEEAGEEPQWNGECVKSYPNEPIFIVEGTMDAMSVMSLGDFHAVAINTTGDPKALKRTILENKGRQGVYIVCEDNDEAGQKGLERLKTLFDDESIPYIAWNISGDSKDANEQLVKNPEQLKSAVQAAYDNAKYYAEREAAREKEEYMKDSAASYLQEFVNGIAASANTPYIPTGFTELDKALDGGLFEGLYTIGAVSSLGKTTMILQIADQIAQAGNDVLIFSLEMARTELMSKSISRLTCLDAIQNGIDISQAKTARGITTGKRYEHYSQTEKELIQRAINAYGEYAQHIFIHEGIGDIGVSEIRERIERHIAITGNRPTVFIDYLQILAPANERFTDKQNVDRNVLELKRISRDFKIPVFAVSSFNRGGYNDAVTMESFKESGAIEYSSDVLMGLQAKGAGSKEFNIGVAKKKNPREIELVILKNRNGQAYITVEFEYYTLFNWMRETGIKKGNE